MQQNNHSHEELQVENERLNSIVNGLEDQIGELAKRNQFLEQYKDEYHKFFDNFAIAIGISSFDGKIIAVNKEMSKIIGYTTDALKQINLADVYVNSEDREIIVNGIKKNGIISDYIVMLKRKTGEKIWANLTAKSFEFNGVVSILTTIVDITKQVQTQEEIDEKERLLRDVEGIAKIGGWEMDLTKDGKATWTKGTYDVIELDYDEPIPGLKEHLAWYFPEYREMIKTKMNKLIETGKPMQFEAQARTQNGKIIWCQAIGEAVVKDGKTVKIRGIFQDITEKHKTEERIRRYSNIFENSLNEIYLFDPVTMKFSQANNAALKNLGYTLEEFIEMTPLDIRTDLTADSLQKLLSPLVSRELDELALEAEHTRKDGSKYDVEVHLQHHKSDHEHFFSAIVLDITQRKRAKEALRKSEERFRLAFENTPDVIVLYDKELRIQYINSATSKLTGRPVSDFIGKKEEEIWPPEVYKHYLPTLKEAFNTHKIRTVETELDLGHDEKAYLLITCVPIIDDNGEIREILGVTHDMTDFKRNEIELKKHRDNLEYLVKERTEELVKKNKELDNTLKVFVGRELTIRDLQRRINALEGKTDFDMPSR